MAITTINSTNVNAPIISIPQLCEERGSTAATNQTAFLLETHSYGVRVVVLKIREVKPCGFCFGFWR